MSLFLCKKNKINLSDYNYKRDIEARLLLASLNSIEIDIFREIIDHSLVVPIKQLSQGLSLPEDDLTPYLEKILPSKLFKIEKKTLLVDKEIRKYFENHIVKFEDSFEPGMDYLQGLLSKVPLQSIQHWYAIPRTSDHIFLYLVEKYLASPKIYEKYLDEVKVDNPIFAAVVKELFSADDLTLSAEAVMKKHNLTHTEFEELALLLEYNFICCLGYKKQGDVYIEVLTPFGEWRNYLTFRKETSPQPIVDPSKIVKRHSDEFGFIQDMCLIIEMGLKKPLSIESNTFIKQHSLPYFETILQKIQFHRFGEISGNKLHIHVSGKEWLQRPMTNKALTFTRHPTKVEKSLKRVLGSGWIYVDDFIKGFTGTLPGKDPVQLQQKGKKWRYALPSYSQEELELIETTLCERLFEAGFVAMGTHNGRRCFTITPFGKSILED